MQQVRGPFLFNFRAAGSLALVVSLAWFAHGASAQTIYKWVDERGVVNYGNAEVPKTRGVSVVDTTPPVTAQADAKLRDTARTPRISDADMLREELLRSREEIARLKQNALVAKAGSRLPDGYAAWREKCDQQHRVDCDEATFAAESQAGGLRQPASYAPKNAPNQPGQPVVQAAGQPKLAPNPGGATPSTIQ